MVRVFRDPADTWMNELASSSRATSICVRTIPVAKIKNPLMQNIGVSVLYGLRDPRFLYSVYCIHNDKYA